MVRQNVGRQQTNKQILTKPFTLDVTHINFLKILTKPVFEYVSLIYYQAQV